MALNDLELSLMAFPQSWDPVKQQILVNLMLLPVGNPLTPLGTGPKFAGTTVFLNAQFISSLDALPTTGSAIAQSQLFTATPPAGALSLFEGLLAKLPAGTTINGTTSTAPAVSVRIRKSLPPSYTNAFPFERPSNEQDFVVGDGYGCALKAQSPGQLYPKQSPPPKAIAWGQILSYALRQPQLAMALGLIYQVQFNVSAAKVANGGWLYFTLDTSSTAHPWVNDFNSLSDKVKSYAARIPALVPNAARSLFAATLFPVVAMAADNLANAQLEAEIYDDGFGQVVHCNQPTTVDAATGDPDQIAPGAETGIQIGWDDEQVTNWFNGQLDLLRFRHGGPAVGESPLGVLGYRIDVQQGGTSSWNSLCDVTGNLPFSGAASNGSGSTPSGELWVQPAPIRPVPADWVSVNVEEAWLPQYFSQWRGKSLVVHDDTISQITPGTIAMPSNALQANLTGVPTLRYGNDYNFRVRFVDLTGGGPGMGDKPLHPGLAPTGTCSFRRYIPPKSLEVVTAPAPHPTTVQGTTTVYPKQDATRIITSLAVTRPRIGYPEALFAGVSASTFTGASLTALLAQAKTTGRALSVPDPDVDRFQVTVEARIPAHDTGTPGTLPGDLDGDSYRILYSLVEHFGAGSDPVLNLSLNYVDTADVSKMTLPPDNAAVIPVPTGRDIRIRLQALSTVKNNYYGTAAPPPGLVSDYSVRKEATAEASLFPFLPEEQLQAFFFQPGDNLPQLLAQQLGLRSQSLTLSGAPGQRIAFGTSGALRSSISADGGAITFTNLAEFLDHWIVAFVIDIARDWTWDGFAQQALTFFRDGAASPIGVLNMPQTVPAAALGVLGFPANRSTSRLIFFDALKPDPAPGFFPAPLKPQYKVVANFKSAPAFQQSYTSLVLPITTRPAQTPRIVSTGIAESPFQAATDYSETSIRERYLWIEFDQPIADPEDNYFARILAYGPDPLLAGKVLPPFQLPNPVEPPIPIDPELVRAIFATQSSDTSGLDAMTPLIAASPTGTIKDGVHFILPLPHGIPAEALDLFGFWTYEFRVGHTQLWSTAQGRYGRPLRVTGIQHPAPTLICTPNRNAGELYVSAPYATTVLNGVRLYDLAFGDPQTVIWFMLYTQVLQTDGASYRNILIAHIEGMLQPDSPPLLLSSTPILKLPFSKLAAELTPTFTPPPVTGNHSVNREPRAYNSFSEDQIEGVLSLLALPLNSPLSVLAVELLPGPLNRNFNYQPGLLDQANIAGGAQSATTATAVASSEDPLGSQLGLRRILRTSPLTKVPPIC